MNNQERAEYDKRWSDADDSYSAARVGYTPKFLALMTAQLRDFAGQTPAHVLDLGCGDGFFSGELARRGCRVTGIDLSPAGVEKARARVAGATFVVHDVSDPLPFPDRHFDLVWCSEVLEHLFSPLAVLQEIERVLRPGGRLLATVPYHGRLKNVGIALFAFDRHYDPTYPHIRFFTVGTLTGLVRRANLRPDTVTTCGSGLGFRDLLVPTNILLVARKGASAPLAE